MTGIKALLATIIAVLLLPVGLAFSITPIPLGLPIFILAVFLLLVSSRHAVRITIFGRLHLGLFDRWLNWLERVGGERYGRVLRKTRPGRLPKRV